MWCRRAVLRHVRAQLQPSCDHSWLPPSLPYSDGPNKRGKAAPLQERRMRDRFRLWAKGGEGGKGCWSFRRGRTDRYGKPDGGNGGRGGDVILECSPAVWDLSNLQHHLNAKRGGHGASKNQIGSRGSDKVVQVPLGTVLHLVSGEAPSFVEDTSITSLHPWEISDDMEADQRRSVQYGGNRSCTSLRDVEDSLVSTTHSNLVNESSTKHRMIFGSSGSIGFETEEHINLSLSTSESGIEIESDNNAYEMNSAEEEEVDNSNGEEIMTEEEEVQYSVAELTEPGQRVVIARGGEGGLGNCCQKKDSKSHKNLKYNGCRTNAEAQDGENQSSLTAGTPGSDAVLILELKSIADVGLVGMPNAGKSTLLGAISRAKPAVGHYAFTTLRPNIGNLNYEDSFSVTVADIPGLIKGAHENRGLGHAFLRHIERTKVLVYVVDLAAALNGRNGITPWEQLRDLVLELKYYREEMLDRPSLVVANKIDEEGAEAVYEELKRRVRDVPIFPVCAVLEEGIPELKDGLRRLMDGSESLRLDPDKILMTS